uniref:RRM domain-containing protein n=1 Tax=Macrostomum lignano TaxID=282301 RepID=A0A1I8JAK0_9PLAT
MSYAKGRVLHIRNLSNRAVQDDLRRAFSKFGYITDITIPLDYYTGRMKGDAREAIRRMDRTQLLGRTIEIEIARGYRRTPAEMMRIQKERDHMDHRREQDDRDRDRGRDRDRDRDRRDRRDRSRSPRSPRRSSGRGRRSSRSPAGSGSRGGGGDDRESRHHRGSDRGDSGDRDRSDRGDRDRGRRRDATDENGGGEDNRRRRASSGSPPPQHRSPSPMAPLPPASGRDNYDDEDNDRRGAAS